MLLMLICINMIYDDEDDDDDNDDDDEDDDIWRSSKNAPMDLERQRCANFADRPSKI